MHAQLHKPLEWFWFGSKGANGAGALFENDSREEMAGEGICTISYTWVEMATACTWGHHFKDFSALITQSIATHFVDKLQ
jgi:hypothetical protein